MIFLPFGQTVMLWRQRRGLSQQALARRAGIPQPNLSAIERGRRVASLPTIRGLAAALGVRAGLLVDGVPPGSVDHGSPLLSRETIERIVDAVAFHGRVAEPSEAVTVQALRVLVRHRTRAAHQQWGRPRTGKRAALAAWIQLKSLYGRSAIQMLADRVLERQRA